MSLSELIKANDTEGIAEFMRQHRLVVRDNKIVPKDDAARENASFLAELNDRRQLARKILLNSLN